MSCLLILVMVTLWGQSCVTEEQYCMYQPQGANVFVGEALTLQCRFVYPKIKENVSEVIVVWKASKESYCGGPTEEFYKSVMNSTFPQYKGRVVLVGDSKAQNASITLMNVTKRDANTYCCGVTIKHSDGKSTTFQSPKGTRLSVRGENDLLIEQPLLIPAFRGDTVTIFSRYTTKNRYIIPDIVSCTVWRSLYAGPSCSTIYSRETCAERTGNDILHFKINHVNSSHRGWYCWEINGLSRDGNRYTIRKERTKYLDIQQPSETLYTNPALIPCTYTMPLYSDIMWIGVYWMVGNPREDFVYHPDTEFIHPDYKGKTELINGSNLLLEDFHGPDNTIFYCRVALLRCVSQTRNFTKTEVIMEEGSGTRLRICSVPVHSLSQQVAIYAGIKLVILLVVLVVAVVYMKKKRDPGL
ncbi:uncharacterized protein LOC134935990 isoform X2 [Pseudophryne corroboree]|uniref:uncharacterized protein LOC134935990 isoform X2 n=1 Tax=Pseudophryne corroboree TaxID=495146 RepID=UPI003081B8DC